jgi:hypothetical protein
MTCMSIFCSNYVTDMAVGMVAILYYFHLKNGLIHAMQSNGPLQQVTSSMMLARMFVEYLQVFLTNYIADTVMTIWRYWVVEWWLFNK